MAEVWSRDQLVGKEVSIEGIGANGSTTTQSRKSMAVNPLLWGRPGHLSEDEADIFVSTILLWTNLFVRAAGGFNVSLHFVTKAWR